MEKYFAEVTKKQGKSSFTFLLDFLCCQLWITEVSARFVVYLFSFWGGHFLFVFQRSECPSFFSQTELFCIQDTPGFCYSKAVTSAVLMSKLSATMSNSFTEVQNSILRFSLEHILVKLRQLLVPVMGALFGLDQAGTQSSRDHKRKPLV